MTQTSKHPEWTGANRGLTDEEINEFLAGPVVARVATVDENGMPYITPVWEEWDGEAMWIIPRERSAWVPHIKANPNIAVSVAMDVSPYMRVLFRGKAHIVSGPEPLQGQCLDIANRMALRYLGEHGPEYLQASANRPRYLIKFVPETKQTWVGVEWASKYTSPSP
jgi:nitroimidazol reductase NimA-like FMN-containing flavoprotein (pyridoxamine 5'-phosphate oxidase superfamily)